MVTISLANIKICVNSKVGAPKKIVLFSVNLSKLDKIKIKCEFKNNIHSQSYLTKFSFIICSEKLYLKIKCDRKNYNQFN